MVRFKIVSRTKSYSSASSPPLQSAPPSLSSSEVANSLPHGAITGKAEAMAKHGVLQSKVQCAHASQSHVD